MILDFGSSVMGYLVAEDRGTNNFRISARDRPNFVARDWDSRRVVDSPLLSAHFLAAGRRRLGRGVAGAFAASDPPLDGGPDETGK